MNVDETKAYFQKLAQEAGIGEAETTAFLQAFGNEKFAKGVADAHKRHDEFSREMDRLRKEESEKQAWLQSEAGKVQQWQKWYEQNESRVKQAQEYEKLYGPLDNGAGQQTMHTNGLTKEEVQKMLQEQLQQRDQVYGTVVKSMARVATDHLYRFKEPLDVDAFERFAVEKNLPPDVAYDQFVAPKVRAQEQAEWDAKMKAAVEEARKDGYSKGMLSQHERPRDAQPSVLDNDYSDIKKLSKYEQEKVSREAFLTGLAEAAQKQA